MTQTVDDAKVARKPATGRKKTTAAKKTVDVPSISSDVPVSAVADLPIAMTNGMQNKADLRPEDYVTVRNGFNGKLVYRSRNTNEVFIWDGLGAEQDMELRELKHARNTARGYFINNWFMFEDPAVPEWLGVSMYYKNALELEDIDSLFEMTPTEIEKTIRALPAGQKETIANRAKELLRTGDKIDSIRVIHALERSLGITLSITPASH